MSRNLSPGLLISCVAAFAFVAFAGGFATAKSVPTDPTISAPIIDPRAWEQTAPQPVTWTPPPVARCDPWEISEVAAEEMLREMVRRGWRPPTHGEVIESLDPLDLSQLAALDPDAPLPVRGAWRSDSPTPIGGEPPAHTEAADVTLDPGAAPAPAAPASLAASERGLN